MYSPYYTDIQTIRSLESNCPIASKIYKELLLNRSTSNIDEIKVTLQTSLFSIPYIPHEYLEQNFDRLLYEIIFEVYHYARIELERSQPPLSIQDRIKYIPTFQGDPATIAQEISRNNSAITADFNNLKTYASYEKKLYDFYLHLGLYDEEQPSVHPVLTPQNTIFVCRSYSNFIYRSREHKKGILLHTVYDMLSNYIEFWGSQTNFDTEYCFYEFNRLSYLTQYAKCCSQYLGYGFAHTEIPSEYFPLYIFSKLFDTTYISLADYISKKYSATIGRMYNSVSVLYPIIIELYLINKFWIPIINLCLKETLFTKNEGNFKSICKECKEWLSVQSSSNIDYTYKSLMQAAKEDLENSGYPNSKNYKNRKNIQDSKNAKTDMPNHIWNVVLSKSFFYGELPDYFASPSYGMGYQYSLDSCLIFT